MKLAIAGSTGRMGQTLIALARETPGVELITDGEPADLFQADAVIDFTAPDYTVQLAQEAAKQKKILVTGTTGLNEAQQQSIELAAKSAVIVQAGNFSLGVNALAALVEQAARSLDARYTIQITDIHHRHKKDAPSGTALMLASAAAKGRGVGREKIECASVREGEVIGDHTVRFTGPGETLELTHRASDREIFARGALEAARWGVGKKPGLYSMKDVLGL